MQVNLSQREITLKVVYYGPALSGKTTNLQQIHQRVDPHCRGHLMVLNTRDDRTLFFDLMPLLVRTESGLKVRLKLFTVPGQVIHDSTRRVVLQNADAVVFVADSQIAEARNNSFSYKNLHENLRANGIEHIPVVIQFNKRDLPQVRPSAEIDALAQRSRERIFKAIAIRGEGVCETLFGLLGDLWLNLEERHDVAKKFGLTRADFLGPFQKMLGLDASPPSSSSTAEGEA